MRRGRAAGRPARRRRLRRCSRRRSRRRSGRRTLISCGCRGFCGRARWSASWSSAGSAMRISEKTAGRYLRAWGFSPQKPARRAFEQDPAAVEAVAAGRLPRGRGARPPREEPGSCGPTRPGFAPTTPPDARGAPVGQTPVVAGTGQRFGANVVSAISNQGQMQFMVFKKRFVAKVFVEFLTRLVRQAAGQKVILILDGHPVHRSDRGETLGQAARRADRARLPARLQPRAQPDRAAQPGPQIERARPPPPRHPARTHRRHPRLPPLNPTPTPPRRPLLRRPPRHLRQSSMTDIYRPE